MADTVIRDRDKYIGGSDIPAVMGCSPWKSRYDLLIEKATCGTEGQGVPLDRAPVIEYGNTMEPVIRDYINDHLREGETPFIPAVKIQGKLRGNTDGLSNRRILEVKTTAEYDTEKPPLMRNYVLQTLFYMSLFGLDEGLIAVYERPESMDTTFHSSRIHLFPIFRKDYEELEHSIYEEIDKFLTDLEYIRNANPFADETELPSRAFLADAVQEVIELRKQADESKAAYEKASANLMKKMNDAKIRIIQAQGNSISVVPATEPKTIYTLDENALKEKYPDVYQSALKSVEKGARREHIAIKHRK